MALDLDRSGRIPQTHKTYLGPSVGWKYTDEPTDIEFVVLGGGQVVTSGFKGTLLIPEWVVINNWYVQSYETGSIVWDVWKRSQASILAGTQISAADSICGGSFPTLSTAFSASGLPTGWAQDPATGLIMINQNDVLGFNVNSCSNIQRATLTLQCVRIIGPS